MEVGNIRTATFKNFLHLGHKNTQLLFCDKTARQTALPLFILVNTFDNYRGYFRNCG